MSVIDPVRSARHCGATRRADPDRVGAAAVDDVQQRGVGAVGADQRERERLVERVLAGTRLRDPRERLHGAARPDLDPVVAVGGDRRAGRRVVLGRRHEDAAVGEPHREDAAVAQPGEEPPDDGTDRAGVAARVLDDVMGREDVGQQLLLRHRRGERLPGAVRRNGR